MAVTFFDILGIDVNLSGSERLARAVELWPADLVYFQIGMDHFASVEPLMEFLQSSLQFKSITPGAAAGTVGFYAEINIAKPVAPLPVPLVIHTMPDVAFYLQDTRPDKTARCFVSKKEGQFPEIVIEGLPVEIQLPAGLITPISPTEGEDPPSPLSPPFDAGIADSYTVELKEMEPTSIFVHIKIRLTSERDFIVEPAVVVSVGPCLFSGLPCLGVHDISLIAAPTLLGDHQKVEQAVEWTRHTIEPSESLIGGDTDFRGVVGVRTLDIDNSRSPFKELSQWLNNESPEPNQVQFVLQDLVFPFFNILMFPVPIHATLGIRRNIEYGDSFEEAYSFASSPVKIQIAGFLILIDEFVIETVDPAHIEDSQVARVKILITRGTLPKVTILTSAMTDVSTSVTVEDGSVFDGITPPFFVVVDRSSPGSRETIKVLNPRSGNELTGLVRGDASVAHASGSTIEADQFAENAVSLEFTDNWTARAGWRKNKGYELFTIGAIVKFMGAKIGFNFRKLYENNKGIAEYSFWDYWQFLVDLNLEIKASDSDVVRLEVLSNSFNPGNGLNYLSTAVNSVTPTLIVNDSSVFSDVALPGMFIIDKGRPAQEEIIVLSITGNQLNVSRGQVSHSHEAGAAVEADPDSQNAGSVSIAWRDIGWSEGSLALGTPGSQFPEGLQLVLFNYIKFIIQEIAVLTEKNGGTYGSFSGGIAVEGSKYSASLFVIRFRKRIAGNENAAKWLLDGISLSLRIGSFELKGIGMAGEFTLNDHLYKEMQFGLELKFQALQQSFNIGVLFYKGQVSGPRDNFTYWLFAFKVGFIPLSGIDLYNIRMLAAGNLAPNLEPPDSTEQNLRLFRWYKNATSPLEISTDRKMNAWIPRADSFSFGVGTGGGIGGTKTLLLDMFIFGHSSPSENTFMIALELFLLKSQKAIGFGVLEIDLERGKWAFFLGVSLSFSNVLPAGTDVPGLENVAALSGNLYLGNKPGTFALGQLTDQDTWLGFRMKEERFFKMELVIAICIQFVDRESGPKGFGGLITAKGGVSFGVGKAEFYFNFLLIAGIWKNESSASGLIIVFEAGFRIKLFSVFNFGASIKVEVNFLGPNPEYKKLSFTVHIGTPWYMPDVTIRFEKVYRSPEPERQPLISIPVSGAESFIEGIKQPGAVLLLSPEGGAVAEKRLYNMEELRAMDPVEAQQSELDEMDAIGVDSTIALNFKPPVDNEMTIGEETPAGSGTQGATAPATSELSVTYQLISFSIRRQQRYGPEANEWTDLLSPSDTEMPDLEDLPEGDELEALFTSVVKLSWDGDVQTAGRMDPRRLLINSETPFTLVTDNLEADETRLISQPGWPCCGPREKETWHRISYSDISSGTRVPGTQFFTDSQSTLSWLIQPRPLVAPALNPVSHPQAALVNLHGDVQYRFAVVSFDEPAYHFRVLCYWIAQHRLASIIMDGFKGLERLVQKGVNLSGSQSGFIELQHPRGFTHVVFRFIPEQIEPLALARYSEAIEIVRLEYRTVAEHLRSLTSPLRCNDGEGSVFSGKGKLAWLPNHNYEITATTRIRLQHEQSGMQEAEVVQRAYFRTKGMIGLNWVDHIGQEIEPYVAAVYARSDAPVIYREEPVALAFREQFNILLPVDRDPDPENPAELNQVLEWDLTVDKEGDAQNHHRISRSSPDWIIENRGTGGTNPFDFTIPVGDVLLVLDRLGPATGILLDRLGRILNSPFSCSDFNSLPPVRSQVLIHQPADTSSESIVSLWQPNTAYRANLKEKGGPCIHRSPFERGDETSFKPFTEEGFAPDSWGFQQNGSIILAPATDPGRRHYAVFGDDNWNHLQVTVELVPAEGVAGFAVGIKTSAFGVREAMLALIDGPNNMIRVQLRSETGLQTLDQTPIPPNLQAPYQLEIISYDDKLEVKLGEARLIVEKGAVRSGQLALVARRAGEFKNLVVESLDAFRFNFQSSRFESFEKHILSAGHLTHVIPAGFGGGNDRQAIQDLYAATSADIIRLMQAGADTAVRLNLFMHWIESLALPFAEDIQTFSISRLVNEDGTLLLLFESPEPLRFTSEIELRIRKRMNLPEIPVIPGLNALQSKIPAAIKNAAGRLPQEVRCIESADIGIDRIALQVSRSFIQSLSETPRYGLFAIAHEGQLKYFLFELTITMGMGSFARVRGRLRDENHFNPFFQQFLIRALVAQMRDIAPNQVLLLNGQGVLIEDVEVPDLSIPFLAPVRYRLLSNGDENRTVVIPLISTNGDPTFWTPGVYRFEFNLSRQRYPQETPDTNSQYNRSIEIELEW